MDISKIQKFSYSNFLSNFDFKIILEFIQIYTVLANVIITIVLKELYSCIKVTIIAEQNHYIHTYR